MSHCPNCQSTQMQRNPYGWRCYSCGYRAATQLTIDNTAEPFNLRGEIIRNEAPAAVTVPDRNQLELL